MNNDLPLLTIAIPTFNRSGQLSRLLDSLIPQLEKETRVELLIADNASFDDTPAVLEQYRSRGLCFRGLRNQSNLGPDGNFLVCFYEASGKYMWIIGDDDLVLPNSLSIILELLSSHDLDLVYLDGRDMVSNTNDAAQPPAHAVEVIDNPRTFVRRTHVLLTFITGNIVNRQRVTELPHRPLEELVGTNLIQLGWTYTLLRYFRKGAMIRNPVIAAGDSDRGGYRMYEVFGTNLKRITETWLVEPALVRVVVNGTLQRFFPAFVLSTKFKQDASINQKTSEMLHTLFSRNYRYHFFIYPLLRLPGRLARGWFFICRIVNRLDRAFDYPMLR